MRLSQSLMMHRAKMTYENHVFQSKPLLHYSETEERTCLFTEPESESETEEKASFSEDSESEQEKRSKKRVKTPNKKTRKEKKNINISQGCICIKLPGYRGQHRLTLSHLVHCMPVKDIQKAAAKALREQGIKKKPRKRKEKIRKSTPSEEKLLATSFPH